MSSNHKEQKVWVFSYHWNNLTCLKTLVGWISVFLCLWYFPAASLHRLFTILLSHLDIHINMALSPNGLSSTTATSNFKDNHWETMVPLAPEPGRNPKFWHFSRYMITSRKQTQTSQQISWDAFWTAKRGKVE